MEMFLLNDFNLQQRRMLFTTFHVSDSLAITFVGNFP